MFLDFADFAWRRNENHALALEAHPAHLIAADPAWIGGRIDARWHTGLVIAARSCSFGVVTTRVTKALSVIGVVAAIGAVFPADAGRQFPPSIADDGHHPGVAPMRASARFEPVDYQPGVPPRVVTTPNEQDLADLVADVRGAKERSDAVVLSLHWGVHFVPRLIADYQKTVAQAAFAAGADLILGHHAHVPKAIEVREGKTCFYSLSNFIMSSEAKVTGGAAEFQRNYGVPLDPEYPNMPYGIDAKRSLIAKAVISRDAIRTSFLPVIIDPQLRPEIICASDPRFDDMLQYMEWTSEGFAHRFAVDGDEIAISG